MTRILSMIAAFSALAAGPVQSHELPETFEQLSLVEVARGVWVAHGTQQLPDRGNRGFMSNSGFVVTPDGVIVIDSGGGADVARALMDRIAWITPLPIIAVFNSHVHGDHWLGNAAILERYPGIPVYAHRRAIERLRSGEAERWAGIFRDLIGEDGPPKLPTESLEGNEAMTFGGVELRSHHTGPAHTDSDIMVELPDAGVLFTGDIVEYGRAVSSDVPEDFFIEGQIEAIEYALSLNPEVFVPGHGTSGGREVPQGALDFLMALHASVVAGYEDGLLDYEMRDRVAADMAAYADWFNFDELGRLISHVYLQVEAASFD